MGNKSKMYGRDITNGETRLNCTALDLLAVFDLVFPDSLPD